MERRQVFCKPCRSPTAMCHQGRWCLTAWGGWWSPLAPKKYPTGIRCTVSGWHAAVARFSGSTYSPDGKEGCPNDPVATAMSAARRSTIIRFPACIWFWHLFFLIHVYYSFWFYRSWFERRLLVALFEHHRRSPQLWSKPCFQGLPHLLSARRASRSQGRSEGTMSFFFSIFCWWDSLRPGWPTVAGGYSGV